MLTSPRWKISHTVLAWSPLKSVCLASSTLLILPQAARVEGGDILQPVGHGGDLARLVPGQHPQVVGPHGCPTPHVVRGHHQVAVQVIAALLASPVMTGMVGSSGIIKSIRDNLLRQPCPHTVLRPLVIEALCITVLVTLEVWGISSTVYYGLL